MSVNILSSGNGALVPVSDGHGDWAQFTDFTPDGYSFPTNINDANGDGIPDAHGAGFFDSELAASDATQLGKLQYGVDPTDGTVQGYSNPMPIVEGEYQALDFFGVGSLTTQFLSNNLYHDPGVNNSVATSANIAANEVNVTVPVAVFFDDAPPSPEPASLSLMALGGLTVLRHRRR